MVCSKCYEVLPREGSCLRCKQLALEELARVEVCFVRIAAEFKPSGADRAMFVWRFDDAPECLRALSTNGGDEDWLVYMGADVKPDWVPSWVEAMDAGHEPDRFDLPNGAVVFIGAHA